VVDDMSPGIEGGTGHLGFGGVDRDQYGGPFRQLRDEGYNTAQFVLGRHWHGTRAGRFASDINNVGAVFDQAQRVLERGATVKEPSTIGKAVGRDIHDAHEPGQWSKTDGAPANRPEQM